MCVFVTCLSTAAAHMRRQLQGCGRYCSYKCKFEQRYRAIPLAHDCLLLNGKSRAVEHMFTVHPHSLACVFASLAHIHHT